MLNSSQSVFLGEGAGASQDYSANRNNSFIGYQAGYSNTTGYWNTANGSQALYYNTTGYNNTSTGYQTLYSNTTGTGNIASGAFSLYANTTGSFNTANGAYALFYNTTGSYNTANGVNALFNTTTGNNNTAIGYNAGSSITSGSNNICIGYSTQVPTPTADNQIRLGNAAITYAGIQVAWTVTSDKRLKENIQNSSLGLNFVNKLRPVSYVRKNDTSKKLEFGFIAQEVASALKEENIQNTGFVSVADDGTYSVRYNDFFAPIVKSIQELTAINNELKKENEHLKAKLQSETASLKVQNTEFQKRLELLEKSIMQANANNNCDK